MYTFRRFDDDPHAFRDAAGRFMFAREDIYSLHIGITDRLIRRGPYEPGTVTFLTTVEAAGELVGFSMRTPPHKLLLSGLSPDVAEPLVDEVRSVYDTIPAVTGSRSAANATAEAWCRAVGGSTRVSMELAIHRLDRLDEPPPVPGVARRATTDDLDFLVEWNRSFHEDVGLPSFITSSRENVAYVIAEGHYLLWEVDGTPVSLAGSTAHTEKGARIGPVFTPCEHRGRGYGTAVTAAITRDLLRSGKQFTTLYTDLANPTSNRIYHRLGYRVIGEVVDVDIVCDPSD